MIDRDQLELSLDGTLILRRNRTARGRRPTRAQWWFGQMRQVVQDARDWPPAPPEQTELEQIPVERLRPDEVS